MSRPRKPPSKMLRSARVLAIHPPGEIQQELLEDALEKGDIGGAAVPAAVILVDVQRRPGMDRRIDVAERPFIGRELAVGCIIQSRVSSRSCCLANSGSISDKLTQWKARSQAANQGYSHLSGIEMMSAALRWRQSLLRPYFRVCGRRRLAPDRRRAIPRRRTVELLAPEQPGERLALHEAKSSSATRLEHGIEGVGPRRGASENRIEPIKSRCSRRPPGSRARTTSSRPAALRGDRGRRPWCRCRAGLTPPASPSTTKSSIPSLK